MVRLTLPILFLLLAAGIFFGYIDSTYDDIQNLLVEEEKFDQALDKSKELQEIRDSLLSKYNTFSASDINRLMKLVPDNVDNVRLVLDIDNIASAYGMRIKNVTVNKAQDSQAGVIGPDEKLYESVILSFSIASSYENLISFLEDLEASLRIVDITELSLAQSKTKEANLYEYNIGVRTYWLK